MDIKQVTKDIANGVMLGPVTVRSMAEALDIAKPQADAFNMLHKLIHAGYMLELSYSAEAQLHAVIINPAADAASSAFYDQHFIGAIEQAYAALLGKAETNCSKQQ